MSNRSTFLLAVAFLLIIGIGNITFSGIPTLITSGVSKTSSLPERTPRPLPQTRSVENPLSDEAIVVPKEVSTIQQQGVFARFFNKARTFEAIPDTVLPYDLRRGILLALTSLTVDDVLSPNQVRYGGPAVIERLRSGNIAFTSPSILGVYFNEEADQGPGIGGGLLFAEPWTGPSTVTECGVGFYEVIEVDSVEYCDVVRYDFYDPGNLERSISIAAAVTEEQYCDASCTQPSCKAVCESLIEPNDPDTIIVQVQYEWRDFTPPPPSGIRPPSIVPSPRLIVPILPPSICSLHEHPNPPYGSGGRGILENDGNFGNDDPALVREFQRDMNDLKAAGIGFTFTCSSSLSGCNGSSLVVDGLFGIRTEDAALSYEIWRQNISPGACGVVNGVVDNATWQCLAEDLNRIECSAPPPPPPVCTLHPHTNPPYGAGGQGTLEYDPWNGTPTHWNNDTPSLVLDFQRDMNFLSGSGIGFVLSCTTSGTCDCGTRLCVDGLFGPRTRTAALEYETWRNSVYPGTCGPVNGIVDSATWQCLTEDIETLTCPVPPPPSTITVFKQVTNTVGGAATPSDFTLYVGANPLSSGDTITVAPGDHFITEDLLSGYSFAGFTGACNASGQLTVAPGANATCTLLNTDIPEPASITVRKVVINNSGRSAVPGDFRLYIGDIRVTSGTTLQVAPGTHVITEEELSGYVFTGFSGDCDVNGRVTLSPGESATCTLTNDDLPIPPSPLIMDGTSTITGGNSFVAINLATSFEAATDAIVSNADPASWTSDLTPAVLDEDGLLITYTGQPGSFVEFETVPFTQSWLLQDLAIFASPQIFSIGPFQEIEITVEVFDTPKINEALNVAYFWDSETSTCGCGGPIYTSSCIDSTGDGIGDACVQVLGGSGQSTCATDNDCRQTHFTCNASEQCVEVGGAGINECDSSIDCRPQQHSTCLGFQCVIVPEPGQDTCSVDTDCTGEVQARRACLDPKIELELTVEWGALSGSPGTITSDMNGSLSISGSADSSISLLSTLGFEASDTITSDADPVSFETSLTAGFVGTDGVNTSVIGQYDDVITIDTTLHTESWNLWDLVKLGSTELISLGGDWYLSLRTFTDQSPLFPPVGPQCALVGCTAFEVLAGVCVDSCTDDEQCGFEDHGPSGIDAISSTEQLVDFPQPITGSEFNPPPLPPLGSLPGASCIQQSTALPIKKDQIVRFNSTAHGASGGWHDTYVCEPGSTACAVDLAVGPTCLIGVVEGAGMTISAPLYGQITEVVGSPFGFGQCIVISTGGVPAEFSFNAAVLCGVNSSVAVGDTVTHGQSIGTLHTSGYASSGCTDPLGPNLHFELKMNNVWVTTDYTGTDSLIEAQEVWDDQAFLLENGGCPLLATGRSFPTCNDSDGDLIYDQCVMGGESDIACTDAEDCLRLEHSQCAQQQCVVIPGPGMNQCGDPLDPPSLNDGACELAGLLSPPNFDPLLTDASGYFLLPSSSPTGLYTRKERGTDGNACSWGNQTLINLIYTVSTRWQEAYPKYSPVTIKDLNENFVLCGVNHATHDTGVDVDFFAGCGTDMSCDDAASVALAKIIIDTGAACGIIFQGTQIHDEVNAYFNSRFSYEPWRGQFMRWSAGIGGHATWFHIRVKDSSGTCN